jgi:hypothetical protein
VAHGGEANREKQQDDANEDIRSGNGSSVAENTSDGDNTGHAGQGGRSRHDEEHDSRYA